jgi:TonB family protein
MNFQARDLKGSCGTAFVDQGRPLGRGATATVYPARLGGISLAAKVFHDDQRVPAAKLGAMMGNPPRGLISNGDDGGRHPRLAWPLAILSDTGGIDRGFLMPLLDLRDTFPLDYFYDPILAKKLKSSSEIALPFQIEIARHLSLLVASIHNRGHHFIDMKPQNIRVKRGTYEVSLLDCDGFSIVGLDGTRYSATLLSTDYISPEAYRGRTSPIQLGEAQDRYALAVLIFQLLNRGVHPFQGIIQNGIDGPATNDEKAAQGLYPHGIVADARIQPRPSSIHHLLDDELRALFDQAFIKEPEKRPSALDWTKKLRSLCQPDALARCTKEPNNPKHISFRGKECPACHLEALPRTSPKRESFSSPPLDQVKESIHVNPGSSIKRSPLALIVNGLFFSFWIFIIGFILVQFAKGSNQASIEPPIGVPTPSPATAGPVIPTTTAASPAAPVVIATAAAPAPKPVAAPPAYPAPVTARSVIPTTTSAPQADPDSTALTPAPTPVAAQPARPWRPAQPAIANVSACAPKSEDYPPAALRAEATGTTRVRFEVDATGKLARAEVVKPSGDSREHRLLDRVALNKLSECTVRPGNDETGNAAGGVFEVEYVWKIE